MKMVLITRVAAMAPVRTGFRFVLRARGRVDRFLWLRREMVRGVELRETSKTSPNAAFVELLLPASLS